MEDLLKQAYGLFADLIGSGMCIMPPDKNFLFYEQYDFSKLNQKHRDKENYLIGLWQSDKEISIGYPKCDEGKTMTIDFGDSAHKTGHLAFCNSEIDKGNLPLYENGKGVMVRHPYQPPWNNSNNCTRDQLLAYAAGCWRAGREEIIKRLLDEHNKRTNIAGLPLCQNTDKDCPGTTKTKNIAGVEVFVETDILAPHHIMFLRICGGDTQAYKDPVGQLFLQLDIEFTDKNYKTEKLQLILMAIVCGRLDLYVQVHPNYKENIMHYWDNTSKDGDSEREQAQIGEAFIKVIECELKRYSGQLPPSILGIPIETIKAIFQNFEYMGRVLKGDFEAVKEYLSLFLNALTSDTQKIAKEIEKYLTNALKNPLAILNIPFMPFNPIAQLINNLFNGTDLSEVYRRLNEIQKEIIELKTLSNKILNDINTIPKKTLDKLYTDSINFSLSNFNDYCNAYYIVMEKKGHPSALLQFSNNFISIAETINHDVYQFFSVEDNQKYPYIPFVINCMQLHISCISLSGQSPALIISIIKKYQNWLKKVVNDQSDDSLNMTLYGNSVEKQGLVKMQKDSKLFIKNLYSLVFSLSWIEIIKPPADMILELPTLLSLRGSVKKQTYELIDIFSQNKFDNINQLVDLELLSVQDLPQIVQHKVIEEANFEIIKDDLHNKQPINLNIKLESGEIQVNISSMQIWELCNRQINNPSQSYSPFLPHLDYVTNKILTGGESIINHATLLMKAKMALKNIDEIIIKSNELLNK